MNLKTYCAMDVHHSHTEFEAQTGKGTVLLHRDLATEPRYLIAAVKAVRGPKGITLEEGPMADWVMRVIQPYVSEVIICDPRRNRLISDDEDKSDKIDPGKLITLYRMGELRPVHHPTRQSMMDLRAWVWAYHDQVKLVTAAKNKIKAALRASGVQYEKQDVYSPAKRSIWLDALPRRSLRERLEILYGNLDDLTARRDRLRERMDRMANRHPVTRRFLALPGFGPIRSLTFMAIVDTPFRFATPQKLWRYGGLGLRERQSGDPKHGKRGPGPRYNRRLKAVARGAMERALCKGDGNAFEVMHDRWLARGLKAPLAQLMTARKMLSVPWGMWKSGTEYDPARVA